MRNTITLKYFKGFLGIGPDLRCIFYLNNNVFPALLSEEEEAHYLDLLSHGNDEARNILIEHNLRLVAHICKKFENTGVDKGDLLSIGTIGLIKGINTFSLHKQTRLATYVARCIENEILMYLRSIRNQKSEVSLYEPVGVDKEGNEVTLLDLVGMDDEDISAQVEQNEEKTQLYDKLGILEDKESFVIKWRYGLGNNIRKTQREIAKKMGISRSYVSRIEKKAVQKLRKEIDEK